MSTHSINISGTTWYITKTQLLDTELLLDKLTRQPHHTLDQEGAMPSTPGKGGLGICDLVTWNYALLMRQAWRIYSNPHLLLAQLYQGKRGTHSPIEMAYDDDTKGSVSWGRKGLTRAASKFIQGLGGISETVTQFVFLKTDGVIAGQSCYDLRSTLSLGRIVQSSIYLMNPEQGVTSGRFDPFFPITPLDLSWHNIFDQRLYWPLTTHGEYSSKSGYLWLKNQQTPPPAPRKPNYGKFCGHGISLLVGKFWCGKSITMHSQLVTIDGLDEWNLAFTIRYAKSLKNRRNTSFGTVSSPNSFAADHRGVEIFATIVWSIWTFRNEVIHKSLQPTPLMMANLNTLSIKTTSQQQER
ncbi:hypothetical protein Cgig2_009640 [Carnegiea gigantea]|uniref:Uncharacterized protein n=1 Tax=Carnegiea gigantea TaxID=171969 RepID=A0A9Q1JTK4_9CARY|nr:hypothetical protein Cgig2_009640 [Carnegiea gigantea]